MEKASQIKVDGVYHDIQDKALTARVTIIEAQLEGLEELLASI